MGPGSGKGFGDVDIVTPKKVKKAVPDGLLRHSKRASGSV